MRCASSRPIAVTSRRCAPAACACPAIGETRIDAPIATPDEVGLAAAAGAACGEVAAHPRRACGRSRGRLAPDGFVVSLQNGLEEYRIADLIGAQRTIGAFLTFGGHYKAPGEIVFGGPGAFRIGEIDGATHTAHPARCSRPSRRLQPVEVTDNIFGFLWSKIALGAIYFATATTNSDVTDLYAVARYRDAVRRAGRRGRRGGGGEAAYGSEIFDGFDPTVFRPGATPDPAAIAATWAGQNHYWNSHKNTRTGIWRDLAIHKRKTEVDRLIGPVIEIGARARHRDARTCPGSSLSSRRSRAASGRSGSRTSSRSKLARA